MRDRKSYKSYCPYCGAVHREFNTGLCFIATAVYGDFNTPEVIALRRFRDEVLRKSRLGRTFVAWHYKTSPPIAEYLKVKPVLAAITKRCLDCLDCLARYFK